MNRFLEHNQQHWLSPQQFAEQDPHLNALKKQKYIHEPFLIHQLPTDIPGVYTLVGGRQIGKTTLVKQWMHSLLQTGIDSKSIFFLTGEIVGDHLSLIQIIKQYLDQPSLAPLRYLIIDEVTYIKNWDQGIKYLADMGAFEDVIVILTGSDSTIIKEARMRFPGRRGVAEQVDFHLYPLSFYEFIQLKFKEAPSTIVLFEEFENFLQHGGFLTAINDYAANQKIIAATYRTYSDWIRGDVLKRGKNETFLKEILIAIIKTYGTQVTWNALADHTSISHHDTIREYIELLESMDVLFIQHALIEDKLLAAPKKAKKIIFKDPFIYHAVQSWVIPLRTENPEIIPLLVETCAISHYQRFYPCFYIKAEGEVDLAYVYQGKFFPIEVKWTSQLRPKDLKQISKYKSALILSKHKEPSLINNILTQPLPVHLYHSYIREELEIIREKLEQMTQPNLLSFQQIKIIERILKTKRISLPEKWVTSRYPSVNINGYAYALGLGNSEIYRERAYDDAFHKSNRYFSSPEFISYLFTKKVFKELLTPSIGCLVFYFDENDNPRHAGLIKQLDPELIVESKWGTFNVIFEHKVWYVPKIYGTKIKYYAQLELEAAENHFLEYCKVLEKKHH